MKRLALIFCLICLTACSKEVSSINGEIINIEKDNLEIICSKYVTRQENIKGNDDIGYSCIVKITDDTLIKSNNGEKITINDLQQNDVVSVFLTEQKTLTEDNINSRILEAKEITLIEN